MFGTNEIVGRKTFVNAGEELLVTSIFLTLQGEGPFQGRPALFVRLAKCNLACSFCDTWFDKGDWWAMETLLEEIKALGSKQYGLLRRRNLGLVITGGEPSLQTNLSKFMHLAEGSFAFTQIESNGILPIEGLPSKTVLVVSPKCHENKQGEATSYLKPRDASLARADCLKFVMSAQKDTPYSEVPEWAFAWRADTGKPIYVSPMNIYNRLPTIAAALIMGKEPTLEQRNEAEVISFWEPDLLNMEQNKLNHEYAARYALSHGLYLSLQMHLYASLA